MPCYEWLCHTCGVHIDRYLTVERKRAIEGETLDCPECGNTMYHHPSFNIAQGDCRYPRYDRGLGMMLKNEAHRQEVCRARGLTPVDGDWDIDRMPPTPGQRTLAYEKKIAELDQARAPATAYKDAHTAYRKELPNAPTPHQG